MRELGPRALNPAKHAKVEKALLMLTSQVMGERRMAVAKLDYLIDHVDTVYALKEPLVRTGLKDPSPAVRKDAVKLMVRFRRREFKEPLEKALHDKAGPLVAQEAARAFFEPELYFDLKEADRRRLELFKNEFLTDRWAGPRRLCSSARTYGTQWSISQLSKARS